MTVQVVVCDASTVVALLPDSGSDGHWATHIGAGAILAAPGLIAFQCANILRRPEIAGVVGVDQSAQAHRDSLDLGIEMWPSETLAPRAWELRRNLSIYDAS